MGDDEMYKYLGLGFVGVLVIYIGVKTLKYQSKITNMIEPFSNNKNSGPNIEDTVKFQRDMYDSILKDNRTAVENEFILLEEYAQYRILSNVSKLPSNIISNNPKKEEIINKMIDECTRYKSLIDILNSSMKFIDRK